MRLRTSSFAVASLLVAAFGATMTDARASNPRLACVQAEVQALMADEPALERAAMSTSPVMHLQKIDFPARYYRAITEKMKAQVDAWVEAAPTSAKSAILKSHRIHLQNLESDLLANADLLRTNGVSVDRIQAQIWVHDIGKFTDPDALVAARHAGNPNPFFAAFMDHSKTSQQYLRKNPFFAQAGGIDNVTRQLYYDIAGHDGPAVPGSWWGQTYAPVTKRPHPTKVDPLDPSKPKMIGGIYPAPESPILTILDRLDQPALKVVDGKYLIGGPVKIALQQRSMPTAAVKALGDATIEKAAVWEGLNAVAEGTTKQYEALLLRFGNASDRSIAKMLDSLRDRIARLKDLRKKTWFFASPEEAAATKISGDRIVPRTAAAPAGAIGYVQLGGERRYFKSIDDFFGNESTPGQAIDWAKRYP